jgi:sulfite reductase (ferredoxin)
MGRTQGKAETFAHLGQTLCFVEPNQVVSAAEAIIKFYRDHGNRADRKRARIKYLVHDLGIEKVRQILEKDYFGRPLVAPKPVTITDVNLHHGWHSQPDGNWFLGLSVENGRIKDEGSLRLRGGLQEIVKRFKPSVRLTGQQDLLLCDIETANRAAIDSLLNEYGIPRPENLSMVQKWSMACPAIPTCGLAISESERSLPGIIDSLEKELRSLGLAEERISTRMTGCPNGCARPYQSEIGIVGRSGEKYSLYLGGSTLGTRLSFLFQDLIHRDQLVPTLAKILNHFKAQKKVGESFGEFCHREGVMSLAQVAGIEPPKAH